VEQIIAGLLRKFEEGKLDRRQLIRSITTAVAGGAVIAEVPVQAATIGATKINHISYRVSDYAKTRDFYSGLLGMKVTHDDGKEKCSLTVGAMEIHVSGSREPLHAVDGKSLPLRTPYIDHIDFDTDQTKDAISAELGRRGIKSAPTKASFRIKDPDGYDVTLSAKR
jgi:catechol 2,3-dioxygenase-like lactoylglutathione lyase family enzyme